MKLFLFAVDFCELRLLSIFTLTGAPGGSVVIVTNSNRPHRSVRSGDRQVGKLSGVTTAWEQFILQIRMKSQFIPVFHFCNITELPGVRSCWQAQRSLSTEQQRAVGWLPGCWMGLTVAVLSSDLPVFFCDPPSILSESYLYRTSRKGLDL